MKKLLFILSISFLFQSCFSYKTVSYNSIKMETIETKERDLMNSLASSILPILSKREFKIKKLDGTNIQGKLVSKNGDIMSAAEDILYRAEAEGLREEVFIESRLMRTNERKWKYREYCDCIEEAYKRVKARKNKKDENI